MSDLLWSRRLRRASFAVYALPPGRFLRALLSWRAGGNIMGFIEREISRELNRRHRDSYAGYVEAQKRKERRAQYAARYKAEQERQARQASSRTAKRAREPSTELTNGGAAVLALVMPIIGTFVTWGAIAAYAPLTRPLSRSCDSSFCSGPPATPGDYFLTTLAVVLWIAAVVVDVAAIAAIVRAASTGVRASSK